MKIIIVSYSRTGRNHALATSLALELSIEHIKISEEKNRTNYCSSGQAAIPPERSPCLSSCPPSSSVQRGTGRRRRSSGCSWCGSTTVLEA